MNESVAKSRLHWMEGWDEKRSIVRLKPERNIEEVEDELDKDEEDYEEEDDEEEDVIEQEFKDISKCISSNKLNCSSEELKDLLDSRPVMYRFSAVVETPEDDYEDPVELEFTWMSDWISAGIEQFLPSPGERCEYYSDMKPNSNPKEVFKSFVESTASEVSEAFHAHEITAWIGDEEIVFRF